MRYVDIHDMEARFLEYLKSLSEDKETIAICREGEPIAELSAYQKPQKLKFGLLKGKIHMEPDFDELPEDFMRHFR